MDARPPASHTEPGQGRRVTLFSDSDGTLFSVTLSAGCELFVGRFVRLPELRTADHVIRFEDLAPAS